MKLSGLVGGYMAWLGWGSLVVAGFGAFLLGGIVGIGLMLDGRAGRRTAIPFGPYMLRRRMDHGVRRGLDRRRRT